MAVWLDSTHGMCSNVYFAIKQVSIETHLKLSFETSLSFSLSPGEVPPPPIVESWEGFTPPHTHTWDNIG